MPLPAQDKWNTTGKSLGRGGQGDIHLVTAVGGDGTEYAMKLLRHKKSAAANARFQREINAIKSIDAPGIVKVVDHSEENAPHPYYVMKIYTDYISLDKVVSDDSSIYLSNPINSIILIHSICTALKHAHDAGIVHRDLKPQNILVGTNHEVVLIDFGCCHILDDEGIITLVDEGVGARYYMAPECEPGNDIELSKAADVYSLGKLLWFLVTGKNPFSREKPAFTSQSFCSLYPNDWTLWHLDEVLEQSVRSIPSNRAQDAGALAEVCKSVLAKIKTEVKPPRWVSDRCVACNSKNTDENQSSFEGVMKLDAFVFLGNANNNPHLYAKFCYDCGHVVLRDRRPVDKIIEARGQLD